MKEQKIKEYKKIITYLESENKRLYDLDELGWTHQRVIVTEMEHNTEKIEILTDFINFLEQI